MSGNFKLNQKHQSNNMSRNFKLNQKHQSNNMSENLKLNQKHQSNNMSGNLKLNQKHHIQVYTAKQLINDIFHKKSLKIPDIQREIDDDHVKEIVKYQLDYHKKYGCFHFVNCIVIGSINNEYRILDGQHRIFAIKKLIHCNNAQINQKMNSNNISNNNNYNHSSNHSINHSNGSKITSIKPPSDFKILISIIKCNNLTELNEQFMIINMNKAMTIHGTSIEQTFINKFRKYMQQNYKDYLKLSTKPRVPHFNLNHIDKYMKDFNVIKRLNELNVPVETFIKEINELNKFIKNNANALTQICGKINDVIKRCNKKKCKKKLYLKVYNNYEWIEVIILKLQQNTTYDKIYDVVNKKRRITIPEKLRQNVWKKRNENNVVGQCFICKSTLTNYNFDCGHIISLYHNGETKLNNLEPICRTCNLDMSIMNLNEYKRIYDKMCEK